MSETNKGMIAAINRYLLKIEELIAGGGSGGGGGAAAIIYESTTVPAGGTRTYDLVPLIPAGSEVPRAASVEVKIRDTVNGSLTKDCYIDASAVLTWGIKDDGTLVIANPSSATVAYIVIVRAPHKKIVP
ncbi:hypothetical protein RVBP21_1030 [Pseudomonas phage BRkr]|nr:hypothetical protein RVBP21_1030 [Pseudomonas phage BRkr]